MKFLRLFLPILAFIFTVFVCMMVKNALRDKVRATVVGTNVVITFDGDREAITDNPAEHNAKVFEYYRTNFPGEPFGVTNNGPQMIFSYDPDQLDLTNFYFGEFVTVAGLPLTNGMKFIYDADSEQLKRVE